MPSGTKRLRSEEVDARLTRVMPGGNTRAATFFRPYPLAFEEGNGWQIWDVDGNEFIDLLNNYTSLVHGHRHPVIEEAILAQLRRGIVFPAPGPLQADLGERICRRFASVEQLRFTNSGTEAVMMAVRAARAFTGRDGIVKAAGGYHGAWEQVAMSSTGEELRPVSPVARRPRRVVDAGIPAGVRELVRMVAYNDCAELRATVEEHAERTAALILEPVIGEETVPGTPEFLRLARELCDAYGIVLIFDEVVTARLHELGVQGAVGVSPDLTTLGKIIGGGLPVGAFGGRAEIMELFNPRRPEFVPHHGTFNGNLLTMAAGCASLDLLTQSEIDRINALGDALAAGLVRAFARLGAPFDVTSVGSLVLVHAPDLELLLRFHAAGLDAGLYFAPRGLMCISAPMDADVVDEVVSRAASAAGRALEGADGVRPRGRDADEAISVGQRGSQGSEEDDDGRV